MTEKRPTLCVVAGPNGSGKTTTTVQLLNNEWAIDSLYVHLPQPLMLRASLNAILMADMKCRFQRWFLAIINHWSMQRRLFLSLTEHMFMITRLIISCLVCFIELLMVDCINSMWTISQSGQKCCWNNASPLPGDRYLAAISARLLLPGTCPHGSPTKWSFFLKKMWVSVGGFGINDYFCGRKFEL